MFPKQSSTPSRLIRNVKFTLTAAAFAVIISAPTLAFAKSSSNHESIISAKFSVASTQTPEGLKKVYKTLKRKAAYACKGQKIVQHTSYRSSKKCAADIMNQFIADANLEALTRLHFSKK